MGKKVDDNNAKCYSGRFTVIIEQRKKLQKNKGKTIVWKEGTDQSQNRKSEIA